MHAHAQKPKVKATQKTMPVTSVISSRVPAEQGRSAHSSFHLQGVPVNQLNASAVSDFGLDFSQIPVGGKLPLGIQAKLKIGQPNDKYEQEADRVADLVMRMTDSQVQRRPLLLSNKKKEIQTKPIAEQITPIVSPEVASGIQSLRGGGKPLSLAERGFFEPRFGADFGNVRVHSDLRAASVARAVNARAFTIGKDIVFNNSEYAPETKSGQKLLAHELTHIVQQRVTWLSLVRSPLIQLQPVNCTPQITGVAPPSNPTQEVIEAHNLAVKYGRIALSQLEAMLKGRYVPFFIQFSLDSNFRNPNTIKLKTIRNRFIAINRRLSRGTRIYRCNRGGGSKKKTLAAQYCPSDGSRTRIYPGLFQVGIVARALTLLHEAAHAAGACDDVKLSNAGYPGANPINNAYSYETFARTVALMLVDIPFRKHTPRVPSIPAKTSKI